MTARPENRNGTLFIIHADGTEESISQLVDRVCQELPEHLRGHMNRVTVSRQGNFRLAFDNDYFPKAQGNDQSANDRVRASAIAKRFAIMGAVVAELSKLGLKAGEDYSPRDTYQGQDNRYYPTTQLWVNTTTVRQSAQASVVTDEDLLTQAFSIDAEKAESIVKGYDEEKGLTTIMRARLKALVGKAGVDSAASKTEDAPAPGGDDDEMPVD
jgi:hypothetical protein